MFISTRWIKLIKKIQYLAILPGDDERTGQISDHGDH